MKKKRAARLLLFLGSPLYAALVLWLFSRSADAAYRFHLGLGFAIPPLAALLVLALRGGLRACFSVRNLLAGGLLVLCLYYPLEAWLGARKLVFCLLLPGWLIFCAAAQGTRRLIAAMRSEDSPLFLAPGERALPPRVQGLLVGVFAFVLLEAFRRVLFYPCGETADSVNQWMQIHGELPYSDIHSIGHTLFMALLLRVWDSYVFVVLFQFASVAAVFALFAGHSAARGVHLSFQLLLTAIFLTPVAAIDVLCYPLKDTPYTVCAALLTWQLIRYTEDGKRFSAPRALLFGVLLAAVYEFRKNGVVLLLLIGLYYLISCLKLRRFRQLAASALAALCVLGGLHWFAYGVLGTKSPANGWGVQVFGTGLIAMAKDGTATNEELEEIGALLPLDWAMQSYRPWDLTGLLWWGDGDPRLEADPELEVFNNGFVLAMCEHRAEIVKLYFRLLPRHFPACFKNVLYSTHALWGVQPSERLPLSNCFLLAWLALLCGESWSAKRRKQCWPVFLPLLLNLVSIAISTTTNELRYLLPTTLLCPLLSPYLLADGREENSRKT